MTEALKPRPFCGEMATTGYTRDGRTCGCLGCGARVTEFNGPTPAEDRVRAKWNRRVAPSPWQPIETAPKDGQTFLAYLPPAYRNTELHIYVGWMGCARFHPNYPKGPPKLEFENRLFNPPMPTHWMPLPAPPSSPAEGGE